MTRATVLVNNFNYGRYVGVAIDSALAQTHPDTQVVVVDDGSTDESRDVIASFGDRVTVVLQRNGGQTSALNAGFAVAEGDLVIFLDADDLLHPEAVATASALLAPGGVTKAHWPLEEIDASGRRTSVLHPRSTLPTGDLRDAVLRDGPEACVFPPTSGNAFAAEFLRAEMPLADADVRIGSASADAYLSTLAAVHGLVAASRVPLGSYRVHGENDFASKPFPVRLEHYLRTFEHRCEALALRSRELGLNVDGNKWREHSWLHRLERTSKKLAQFVGEGSSFVLADGGEWGADFLAPRRAFLLMERDGDYWGPPADTDTAIAEIGRLRACGAAVLAIGWPAFWWFAHYAELRGQLEARYPVLLEDDDLCVFDLRP